jgi:predicted ATP-grasp superfamily ATP-dependent carboligase
MSVAAPPSTHTAIEPTEPIEPMPVRTVATIGLLTCALPLNLVITALALVHSKASASAAPIAADPKTVLISGGKMTKALHLARAFHRSGHRVILVEGEKYRLTGHRFSRAVDRFYTVPPSDDPGYASALVDIVVREAVDVYVPVCSPASAMDDARAKAELSEYCEVLHPGPDTLTKLDDKFAFSTAAQELDLPVPDAHRISDPEQVTDFDFEGHDPPYILKSIAYDPIRRLDLTPLPQPDPEQTRAFVTALPISRDNPWIMQAFVPGQEYCTHSTVRDGRVQLHCCCTSSASQLNYEMVDVPEIEAWVKRFVAALHLTGQASFDFIRRADGRIYAIECNPRSSGGCCAILGAAGSRLPGSRAARKRSSPPTIRSRSWRSTISRSRRCCSPTCAAVAPGTRSTSTSASWSNREGTSDAAGAASRRVGGLRLLL